MIQLIALLFSVAGAASPATDPTIDKLFAITQVEKLTENSAAQFDALKESVKAGVIGKKPAADKAVAAFRKELDALMGDFKKENLSFAAVKPDLVKIYKDIWSEEELQDLIRFYETPTGKKSIETAPAMMKKTVDVIQMKLQAKFPALQEKIKALAAKHMPEGSAKK